MNGSILVFLGIYASRIGASTFQIGLLTASPAMINLLFTFPYGTMLKRVPTAKATMISVIANRLFYLLLIPLPVLLPNSAQVWVILAITLIMNIPGTLTAIVFNAFFAEAVPIGWRGQVVGTRNALMAVTTMATSLVVGLILEKMPFYSGYQVVFAIGVLGAVMSAFHLWRVRLPEAPLPLRGPDPIMPQVRKDITAAARIFLRKSVFQSLRLDVFNGPFRSILVIIFLFQIGVALINPLVPIYQVQQLTLADLTISQGSALFWLTNFFGSLQTRQFSHRWGFKRMTGYGLVVVTGTLVMFTFSFHNWIYLLQQFIGGIGWALINTGLINYVLESVPVDDRASHLAWYNLATNAALLLCGLFAPLIAGWIGLAATLLLAAALRLLVGVLLIGKPEKNADAPALQL